MPIREPSPLAPPVLLVADDPDGLTDLAAAAGDRWPTAMARGSRAALAFLARGRVAAVVARLDLEGDDGVTVLAAARTAQPAAPRVLAAARPTPSDLCRALEEAEAHRFLPLPAEDGRLAGWLAELVRPAAAPDAHALLLEALHRALQAARPDVRASGERVAALVEPVASALRLTAADRRVAQALAVLHPLGAAVRGPRPKALPAGLPAVPDLGRALAELADRGRAPTHPASAVAAACVAFDEVSQRASTAEAIGYLLREKGRSLPDGAVDALLDVVREGRASGEHAVVRMAA